MKRAFQPKIFLFFLFALFVPPVYAYGGPGVAIAAVLVFITVVFAFFASTFLSIFNFFKNIFRKRNKPTKSINSNKSKKNK